MMNAAKTALICIGILGFPLAHSASAASSSVTFEPYAGYWNLNYQGTLKLKGIAAIPINGSGTCVFSTSTSPVSAGGFQCEVVQNQSNVVLNGTLQLDKKGKHFTFAVDATTVNEIVTLIENAVNGRVGITSPQVTIRQHSYSKLKANASSLGPEKIVFKGIARAHINGKSKSAAFTYKSNLTFEKTS